MDMDDREDRQGRLYYFRVPDNWTKEEKLDFLSENDLKTVEWRRLRPNRKHTWLVSETEAEFESHIPIGSKEAKRARNEQVETIFKTYCPGANSSRDAWVYDYDYNSLIRRTKQLIEDYNSHVDKYKRQDPRPNIDDFVNYKTVKWSRDLKLDLKRGNYAKHSLDKIKISCYRPFTKKLLFADYILNDRIGQQLYFFPKYEQNETKNRLICVAGIGNRKEFGCLVTDSIASYDLAFEKSQCFPFYTYDADGDNRQENITDWALARFRDHYGDPSISKWDIFYYVYALLHHPRYRERYAADLKRQLPRIPLAPDFGAFSQAGETLAGLHLDYERAEPYELDWRVTRKPISYRVDKMLPQNKRKSEAGYTVYDGLKVNGSLTLEGIPERAFAYRLGNRSALDWVVDQYRVKTDKRSGIVHNPNGWSDDERYIVDLVERVVGVSLRTVDILDELAKIPVLEAAR